MQVRSAREQGRACLARHQQRETRRGDDHRDCAADAAEGNRCAQEHQGVRDQTERPRPRPASHGARREQEQRSRSNGERNDRRHDGAIATRTQTREQRDVDPGVRNRHRDAAHAKERRQCGVYGDYRAVRHGLDPDLRVVWRCKRIVTDGARFYAHRMTDAHDNANTEAALRVSTELKAAFDEVGRADIDGADKGRWHRRLIAITNTAKHDVARADEQLARYRDDWNMFRQGEEDAR